jgi:hypothetical protein
MKTVEITRDNWSAFCESFSKQHEGWRVTLEVFGPEIGNQVEERDLALEGIAAEIDGVEKDRIEIMIGARPDDHITHTVARPMQISVEQTDEGADLALAIKAADGATTLLRFRAAVLPEMLDAVAG